ncbi:MAG: AMIN-like domain-containing (lipo)protein, partial [Gemmatimonadota bacterium]
GEAGEGGVDGGEPAPNGAQDHIVHQSPWTAGILDRPRPGAPIATLVDVRTGRHPDFDRVVFEFADRAPGVHTEYIDRPVRQCGSGNVVEIAGDGWLEVRMSPAAAHTEAGEPTVAERERMPGLPVLAELERTCDFEGIVTWVLGVRSPNRYRLLELRDPPRLVVDVRH